MADPLADGATPGEWQAKPKLRVIDDAKDKRIADFRAAALDLIAGHDAGDMLREADGWLALRRLIK